MHYWFLASDLQFLKKRITALESKLKRTSLDIGESVTQSSESWHDNYTFEHGQREHSRILNELSKLKEVLRSAATVQKPTSFDTVQIGSVVTIKDVDNGEQLVKSIGSYVSESVDAISYLSPLGQSLLNTKLGESCTVTIGDKSTTWEVLAIS